MQLGARGVHEAAAVHCRLAGGNRVGRAPALAGGAGLLNVGLFTHQCGQLPFEFGDVGGGAGKHIAQRGLGRADQADAKQKRNQVRIPRSTR